MSLPQYIFLDTNVFDGQGYNFGSVALTTFKEAVRARGGVTLLMPDPIEMEVRRHIGQRSTDALKALNDARRAAPFLVKWEHYPKKAFPAAADWQVTQIAVQEWKQFLHQFTVQKLGYEGVNPAAVMVWYDEGKPPFGAGRKKSEFPDAFAVAILDKFVADNSCAIAVVSQDPDMKLACERRTSFLHFQNLPQLTELLVAGADKVDALRNAILSDVMLLYRALDEEVDNNLSYYHSRSDYEITDSDLENTEFIDIRIVGLGHREAILAFVANVETTQHLQWHEQDFDDEWVTEHAKVSETSVVHGTAKVELAANTQAISAVTFMELEEAELEVNETPYRR